VVQPGVRYVASYRAPQGGYSATPAAFATEYSRGPLTVAASGAVFTYSDGFPSQASTTDYGVDVVFQPAGDSPTVVTTTPATGATSVPANATASATFSGAIQPGYAGSATANGSPVPGTWALSSDRKTATFTPSASYPAWAQVAVSITGIVSETGVAGSDAGWSFTAVGSSTIVSLNGAATPAQAESSDSASVELGMAFKSAVPGKVTAIRFFKSATNTGTHIGSLWGPDGQRLAQVAFTTETATGWQRAVLSTPVELSPDAIYTVSYLAPRGGYSYTSAFFASPVTSGPLTAISPQNGLYLYGAGGAIPTGSWNSTNYFVDVEFVPEADDGQTPLALATTSPARDEAEVEVGDPITATLNQDPIAGSVSMIIADAGGHISGVASFDGSTRTVVFTPEGDLAYASTFTATVTIDGLALDSWTFQTAEPPTTGVVQTLFGETTPEVASVSDADPVELGTAFTVAKAGKVTALRFYKGEGNSGTHRGTLWGAGGEVLATVTFEGESPSGWQRAALSTPVVVRPGTTYTVSYLAPSGGYSYTSGYFGEARVSGDITAPGGDNGRFTYGPNGGLPVSSWNATAYFVDAEIDFGAEPAPSPSPSVSPSPVSSSSSSPSSIPTSTPSLTGTVRRGI